MSDDNAIETRYYIAVRSDGYAGGAWVRLAGTFPTKIAAQHYINHTVIEMREWRIVRVTTTTTHIDTEKGTFLR